MEEQQDYYLVGSRDDIVISSSSLQYINPEQGGSPQRFLSFFEGLEEMKNQPALKFGSLMHKWAENKEAFNVAATPKPSDKLGEVADLAIVIYNANLEALKEYPDDLQATSLVSNLDTLMLKAARDASWNKRYGDDAILQNAKKGGLEAYIKEVIDYQLQEKKDGRIYISAKDAEKVAYAVQAVAKNPFASALLFGQDEDFSNKKVFVEKEVYWKNAKGQQFKAKIDRFIIDFDTKRIILIDNKTTGVDVYNYQYSFKSYRTYRQLAFYRNAIKQYCNQFNINVDGFTIDTFVVAMDTVNLFQCVVWKVEENWLSIGLEEVKQLTGRIQKHQEENQWNFSLEEMANSNRYILMPPPEIK